MTEADRQRIAMILYEAVSEPPKREQVMVLVGELVKLMIEVSKKEST